MVTDNKRDWIYGEVDEGLRATRMISDGRYKLIYYATGNYTQLFDLEEDPQELINLANSPDHAETLENLQDILISQLYGGDEAWVKDGKFVGLPNQTFKPGPNRSLTSQRGAHWPPPPASNMPQIEWYSPDEEDKS